MGTRDIVKSFVLDTFPTGSSEIRIEEHTSFLESGLIDSMGVLELVDFLEDQFGVAFGDDELVPENLDSIRNICRYLKSKGISTTGT